LTNSEVQTSDFQTGVGLHRA